MLLSFPFLCAFLLLFFPAVLLSLFCLNVLQVSIGTSPRNCRAPICAYVYSTHRYVRVCISCAETQAWFISRSWTSWYNSQKLQLQMQLPAASCCWASWQEWFCRTLPLSRLVRHWFIRLRALCDCRSLCCLGTFRSSMFVFLCLFPLRTIQLLRAPCCASQSQVLQSCQEWIAPFAKKKKTSSWSKIFCNICKKSHRSWLSDGSLSWHHLRVWYGPNIIPGRESETKERRMHIHDNTDKIVKKLWTRACLSNNSQCLHTLSQQIFQNRLVSQKHSLTETHQQISIIKFHWNSIWMNRGWHDSLSQSFCDLSSRATCETDISVALCSLHDAFGLQHFEPENRWGWPLNLSQTATSLLVKLKAVWKRKTVQVKRMTPLICLKTTPWQREFVFVLKAVMNGC